MHVLGTKPKVTLDVAPLLETQWTGIPVFTRRLVQALQRHGGVDLEFAIHLTRVPPGPVHAAIQAGTGVFLRDALETDSHAWQGMVDASSYLLYPSVKPSLGVGPHEASTIHDMSTLFLPECHEEPNIAAHLDELAREVETDEAVFCISEATRAAFLSAFPGVAERVRLIYQYADWPERFALMSRNLPGIGLGRYAVVVGTIEPRKNLALLLRALDLPELRRSDIRFVVIGRKGWKVDAFLAGLSPEARQRLIFSGFVSEFTKFRLIEGAEFLVLPSIYEGFGIPAIEAMSLGKPVLASISSSLPEIVGQAGVYFDPLSANDFAAGFAEISSPRKIAELSPLARAGAANFSWEHMAAPVVAWASGAKADIVAQAQK
jgi:glycosyltransferase involved in cell wall biosynthesis